MFFSKQLTYFYQIKESVFYLYFKMSFISLLLLLLFVFFIISQLILNSLFQGFRTNNNKKKEKLLTFLFFSILCHCKVFQKFCSNFIYILNFRDFIIRAIISQFTLSIYICNLFTIFTILDILIISTSSNKQTAAE